jgi:hypothetical protein
VTDVRPTDSDGGSRGTDQAGNLLEIVLLVSNDGNEFVLHAMPMRPQYRKLLEP